MEDPESGFKVEKSLPCYCPGQMEIYNVLLDTKKNDRKKTDHSETKSSVVQHDAGVEASCGRHEINQSKTIPTRRKFQAGFESSSKKTDGNFFSMLEGECF